MITRRTILGAALAGAAIAPARNKATTLHRQLLPGPFEGWQAEFVSVTMDPGPGYSAHQHPGFVLGYVLDGEFRFAIEGQPERVLGTGEVFYEPPGANHTVSASASSSRAARILAIIISPKQAA